MQKDKNFISFQSVIFVVIALLIIAFFYVGNKKIGENNHESEAITALPSATQTQVNVKNLTWPKDKTVEVSVLMYHHIGPLPQDADEIRKGLTVSEENFDSQMKYLKQNSFNVILMNEMYTLVSQNKMPNKAVVLTFDDGYDDNYLYALPVLEKYGFKATFSIITGVIGQNEYMSESQIKTLSQKGHELASHTASHPSLDKLSSANIDQELKESKKRLEQISANEIITLCYPAGKYNEEVEREAAQNGYKMAITTVASKGTFSTSSPFEIPRYRINPATSLDNLL